MCIKTGVTDFTFTEVREDGLKEGDVVGILELMKLMNHVPAPSGSALSLTGPVAASARAANRPACSCVEAFTPITTGTPMTNQAVDTTIQSNGFVYDSDATVAWQLFNATGSEAVALTLNQLPAHAHSMRAATAAAGPKS